MDKQYILEVTYQNMNMSSVNNVLDDICVDSEGAIKEVRDYNDESQMWMMTKRNKDYEESSFSEDDNDFESQDGSDSNEDN